MSQVPVLCPLRMRLAGFLSALIRFNLRVLLNPPPPNFSVPSNYTVQSAGAHRSKVLQHDINSTSRLHGVLILEMSGLDWCSAELQ